MRYRVDVYTDEQRQQRHLEEDVRRGLTARPKSLPPKYFYDRAGSLLFVSGQVPIDRASGSAAGSKCSQNRARLRRSCSPSPRRST